MDSHAVVMADAAGVIRYWSPGAEAVLGHSAAVAVGARLDLIVPPDYVEAHWRGFERAVARGAAGVEGQVGDFLALCADGEVRMLRGRLTLMRSEDNRVIGAMVVFG